MSMKLVYNVCFVFRQCVYTGCTITSVLCNVHVYILSLKCVMYLCMSTSAYTHVYIKCI